MTLLQRLLGTVPPQNLGPEDPAQPLTSLTLLEWLGGPKVHAGVAVTEQTSLGIPAVWRAVTLISGVAASLPLHAYRADDESRKRLTTGAAADLLRNPHPDMTSFELWELVYGSLALWGNAYLRKLRSADGVLRELWWIAPDRVRAGRASDGTKVYTIDGDTENGVGDDTILHIPGFGYDGVSGVSPIRAARQGVGLALAAEEYGARLFGSGSLAAGILQTDQRLPQETADKIKARWKARMGSGMDSAHDIAVLDGGVKFQQLTIPPADAQFLESRQFSLSEMGRIFGTPPILLFDMERSTSWGTGVEQQMLGWVKFSLGPSWLTRVEQRVTKMLNPRAIYAQYALEGLLRGDTAARGAFYRQLWDIGALSTNDIRRLEDQSPVEGGDVRYRPLNMGVLGEPDPAPAPAVLDEQEVPTT